MTAVDDLPPLRETIRRHGLSAKKSLGQNFLLDLNLTVRIARAGGPLDGISVVEIGPGPGGLTRALIAQGARQVIAIERDRRAIAALGEIAAHYPGRLMVIEGDALEIDWRRMPIPSPAPSPSLNRSRASPISVEGGVAENATRIIANLPYNIATALLVRWLAVEPWPPWYESLVLMFQREVAERIVALPGTKQYGRLAVLAGWRTEARIIFDIAPSAFVPPPKVTSSVVRLVPRVAPLACTRATLERVTAAAFGQRRKMLRQSLRALDHDPQPILAAAGIDPTARAEDIAVEGFVALAKALDAMRIDAIRHPKDCPKSLR
jgi:16S rRNA (adenine1518-N6/adenine1519-N6)-dimethyltransferase